MNVHLIDGTYELFRHFFAVPRALDTQGHEVGAVRGVLMSVLMMIEAGATHIGFATDHVIESFRNDLYAGYKTGDGLEPELLSQFPVLEEAMAMMGVKVWPMIEFEADDALAAAAVKSAADQRVEQVLICTPDKDLAQCVQGKRIVQWDRMRRVIRDEDGVMVKWGVRPESIPDYLGLVGDSSDGFPGLPGWGPKAASTALAQYRHLEEIPKSWRDWHHTIRRPQPLSEVLFSQWDDALLYRTLATLRLDVPVFATVDDLQWRGPLPEFAAYCTRLQADDLYKRSIAIPHA